ncbi:MAG: sigma-70 family RNA polymerase sigma factor, partial [Candidatus Hydrogenedentota bacterium]
PLEFDGRAASGTPESDAIRAELRERLRVAVARLEPDQREVFLLKYQAGLGYADIARSLSTTPEAISQKLWRIRKKLQLELREFKP